MGAQVITACDGCQVELKSTTEIYKLRLKTDKFLNVAESDWFEKNLVFCENCATNIKASLEKIAGDKNDELKIVSVALWDKEGQIYSQPRPARHHHVLHAHGNLHHAEQGFLLSDGTFCNRKDAYILAKENGQLRREITKNGYNGDSLFSEDVW